jgi:hypothetical protein
VPEYRNVNCPACGGPAEVDRFAAMGSCPYCGGLFYFQDQAVLAMGHKAILADTGGMLELGRTGTWQGKPFAVVGRVRYRYAAGLWDEWFCRLDSGEGIWLSEDEHDFQLELPVEPGGDLPPWDALGPFSELTIDGQRTTVDEVGEAWLEGVSGSLPEVIAADRHFRFADASGPGGVFTIEYGDDGSAEVFRGQHVQPGELGLTVGRSDEWTGDAEWDGFADA